MLKSRRRRNGLLAVGGSLGLHLALLAGVVMVRAPDAAFIAPEPPRPPVEIILFRPPPPPPPPAPEPRAEAPAEGGQAAPPTPAEPAPEPPAPPRPAPPRPAPRAARVLAPPPPEVEPVPAAVAAPAPVMAPVFATVSEARLAGAATAGSGAGQGAGAGRGTGQGAGSGAGAGGEGAGCDMIGRLQQALRDDAEVRGAVAQAHRAAGGRALLVWDGDWVQTPGQAGKGLAGVRQAIALEVAFAPEACRRQPMRGLVLIRFADGSRVVFGAGSWRWSQLLGR